MRRIGVLLLVPLAAFAACTWRSPEPSILLVVMDTTRWDAVSCNGRVHGTTPQTDRLAAQGLRYTNAYASAPWTLPSHASLFTGVLPHEHGLGWRQWRSDTLPPTMAERLREAGYETAAFSENVWVGPISNLDRGFETFVLAEGKGGQSLQFPGPPLLEAVGDWLAQRRDRRPLFLFVNLMGAHKPLKVEDTFLPAGVSIEQARRLNQDSAEYNCNVEGHERELAILRGLYLGGVALNDERVGALRRMLLEHDSTHRLVTVVTADHGEHLGEHGLVDHQFSVREPLLHVPLIVHGLDVAPAVIDEPVSLIDIMPSVLQWAGASADSVGRPLPLASSPNRPGRLLVAEYDAATDDAPYFGSMLRKLRAHCDPSDRVAGDMRALIQYPHKLIAYSDGSAELYDLDADPGENSDLATTHPEVTAEMRRLDRNRSLVPTP